MSTELEVCISQGGTSLSSKLHVIMTENFPSLLECTHSLDFSCIVITESAEYRWFVFHQVGFFSGRKKESIFKSPDDHRGKVGVTGSGKGLTDFQRREKHLHLKGGSADALDDEE